MQMEFYLAGEITQVIDSIPWVRCASGNVLEFLSHPKSCSFFRSFSPSANDHPCLVKVFSFSSDLEPCPSGWAPALSDCQFWDNLEAAATGKLKATGQPHFAWISPPNHLLQAFFFTQTTPFFLFSFLFFFIFLILAGLHLAGRSLMKASNFWSTFDALAGITSWSLWSTWWRLWLRGWSFWSRWSSLWSRGWCELSADASCFVSTSSENIWFWILCSAPRV